MYNNNVDVTQICSKHFSKEHVKETYLDSNLSYVKYRRRMPEDGGSEALYNDRHLTSAWIVPYSPYLLLKYNCHINMELCASAKATKYVYKYVTKGGDRAMLKVDGDGQFISRNEVREFQDMRSIGASEGSWKLLEFEMTDR